VTERPPVTSSAAAMPRYGDGQATEQSSRDANDTYFYVWDATSRHRECSMGWINWSSAETIRDWTAAPFVSTANADARPAVASGRVESGAAVSKAVSSEATEAWPRWRRSPRASERRGYSGEQRSQPGEQRGETYFYHNRRASRRIRTEVGPNRRLVVPGVYGDCEGNDGECGQRRPEGTRERA